MSKTGRLRNGGDRLCKQRSGRRRYRTLHWM